MLQILKRASFSSRRPEQGSTSLVVENGFYLRLSVMQPSLLPFPAWTLGPVRVSSPQVQPLPVVFLLQGAVLHVRPCSDVTRIWGRYQTVHCPLFPSQSGGQVSSPKLATEDEVARTAQLGCMPRGMSGSAAREGEEAEEGGDRKGGSPRRKGAGVAVGHALGRRCWCRSQQP